MIRGIRHLKAITIPLLLVVAIILSVNLIPISIAKLNYPQIALTIYDQEWYGSQYTISEMTTHRWYEKGQLGTTKNNLISKLQKMKTSLNVHFFQHDNTLLYRPGNHNQICITQDSFKVQKIASSLLSNEYNIYIDSKVDYVNSKAPEVNIHDYGISLEATLKVTGILNEQFIIDQVQELYLLSSIQHLEDYLRSRMEFSTL